MMRWLLFALPLGCSDLIAPIATRVASCAIDSDCAGLAVCHRGWCLEPVDVGCKVNGVLEPGEACDDGNSNDQDACTNACSRSFCGDGRVRNDSNSSGRVYEECDPAALGNIYWCNDDCRWGVRPTRLVGAKGFTCLARATQIACWGTPFGYPAEVGVKHITLDGEGDRIRQLAVMESVAYRPTLSDRQRGILHSNRPHIGNATDPSFVRGTTTPKLPALVTSFESGRTELYGWPYSRDPGVEIDVERKIFSEKDLGIYPRWGFERTSTMRGFNRRGQMDDRAGCWIDENFHLSCLMQSDCRGRPGRSDGSNYYGIKLDRLGTMIDVAISRAATCAARLGSGQVLCWGDLTTWGKPDASRCMVEPGRRAATAQSETELPGVDYVVQLAAGEHHHLGLTDQGDVFEWGWDWRLRNIIEPRLHQFDEIAIAVASAKKTRCVLFESGNVGCWGLYRGSEQGGGDDLNMVPGLPPIVELLDGWQLEHMCARTADDRVFCWGRNDRGQLGDDSGIDEDLPVEIHLGEALR